MVEAALRDGFVSSGLIISVPHNFPSLCRNDRQIAANSGSASEQEIGGLELISANDRWFGNWLRPYPVDQADLEP
jgi:hypothetical protein